MIVLGYNGIDGASDYFASRFGRSGIDRFRILGHDAGAALFVDGHLVAAAEEERFSRNKKESKFPELAIRYCLGQAGLGINDVDCFCFPWNFDDGWSEWARADANEVRRREHEHLYSELVSHDAIFSQLCRNLKLDIDRNRLLFVDHHHAHVFSGLYIHQLWDAAFIVNDGRSERHSSMLGVVKSGKLEIKSRQSIDDSICQFYSKLTRFLGFTPNSDEYKVMGLCGYRVAADREGLTSRLLQLRENGAFSLQLSHNLSDVGAYHDLFVHIFGAEPEDQARRFEWQARSASIGQNLYESALLHQVRYLESTTDCEVLVLEGGGALNCLANGRVARESMFNRVLVGFGANDSGTCIGAAAKVAFDKGGAPTRRNVSPYIGPQFDLEDALEAVAERGLEAERMTWTRLCERVAQRLAEGKVVAWFQGRMEFGPRALGNRSILGDARNPEMRDLINSKVKFREEFRPLAPAVRQEDFDDFFELQPASSGTFMTSVFRVRERAKALLPSVTHCDGTARVQSVSALDNRRFHDLLSAFGNLTSVPCLINTSFNVKGEPIVCSPRDAVNCYLTTNLDVLVVGTLFLEKEER